MRDLVLQVENELSKTIEMENCREAKICLGLDITPDWNKLSLKACKAAYALKVFEGFDMQDCKPVSTPMEIQIDLDVLSGKFLCITQNITRPLAF